MRYLKWFAKEIWSHFIEDLAELITKLQAIENHRNVVLYIFYLSFIFSIMFPFMLVLNSFKLSKLIVVKKDIFLKDSIRIHGIWHDLEETIWLKIRITICWLA